MAGKEHVTVFGVQLAYSSSASPLASLPWCSSAMESLLYVVCSMCVPALMMCTHPLPLADLAPCSVKHSVKHSEDCLQPPAPAADAAPRAHG